jgi:tetratricopeptide (TPR) repeat protein
MPSFSLMTAMAKPGRNDPCPCGSGKKYKRCCLANHEQAERTALAAAAARPSPQSPGVAADLARRIAIAAPDDNDVELATLSNAAVDLVHEGKLDEAEKHARDLLERFPYVHDGWDRLGMVHEARGEYQMAIDCYRKVIDFIQAHPEDYDPGVEATFHRLIERLTPLTPT